MNCMKCGRDIEEDQVFCPICLEQMAKYPVNPATAIVLPVRKHKAAPKKVRRKAPPTPEELLKKSRVRLRRLFILWILTVVLFLAAAAAAIHLWEVPVEKLRPGQNYSSSTAPTQSTS